MSATEKANGRKSASRSDIFNALDQLAEFIREHGDEEGLDYQPRLDRFEYETEDGKVEFKIVGSSKFKVYVAGAGLRSKQEFQMENVFEPEARMTSYSPRYRTPSFQFRVGSLHGDRINIEVPHATHDRRES